MTPRPVTTDLNRATVTALARLARRWGLGELVAAERLGAGTMNRNFQVRTETGTWFAKQYLDASARQVAAQHHATGALAGQGLPVPTPLPLPGEPARTFATSQGRPATIYPWVAGEHRPGLRLRPSECQRLGGLLARLHLGLGIVQRPVQQTFLAPVPDAGQTVAEVDGLLARIQTRPAHDEFDELATARLEERRRMLLALRDRRPPSCALLTTGWVHGDFHGLNLLYGDGGRDVVAILDWDRLGIAPYAYELARAATLLFGFGDDRGLDLARVRAFVGGYQASLPLGPEELAAVAHRLWWVRLNDLWMLQWHYERDDRSCDHLFAGAARLVAWWTERYEQVQAALAGA